MATLKKEMEKVRSVGKNMGVLPSKPLTKAQMTRYSANAKKIDAYLKKHK